MTPKAYSARQLAIIRGELPEEKYTLMQCRQILIRAEKACDNDVISQMTAMMEKKADDPLEIKRAKARQYMADNSEKQRENTRRRDKERTEYRATHFTERQEQILNGSIPFDEARASDYTKILHKAIKIGRQDVIEAVTPLIERKKAELPVRKEKRRKEIEAGAPARTYTFKKRKHRIDLRPPEPNGYTERQKAIIRGDVSFADTHGNEYVGIKRKALRRGDQDIVTLMDNLLAEKKADAAERNRMRAYDRSALTLNDPASVYQNRWFLTSAEKAVLESEIDLDDITIDHLFHIRDVCIRNDDKERRLMAELLILYKTHPEVLFNAKTHDEAMEIIRRNTIEKIDDPRDIKIDEDEEDVPASFEEN